MVAYIHNTNTRQIKISFIASMDIDRDVSVCVCVRENLCVNIKSVQFETAQC